jgi:hypothetical protein
MLVNDVVPLLWSDHLAGHGVIVNSGTGSSVIGRTRAGRLLKLGGHEHILSDQGSAYSMAREGLRAATRAADGLGSATTLLARAEAFYGRSAPSLGRWLAELGRARSEVARFAAEVLAALDHCLGSELHDADKDRQSEFALRDHLAGRTVVDTVRAVEPLRERKLHLRLSDVSVREDFLREVLLVRVMVGAAPDQGCPRAGALPLEVDAPELLRAAQEHAER